MKFVVIAEIYYGGTEVLKAFDSREAAQNHADKLNNNMDMYTFFSVEKR